MTSLEELEPPPSLRALLEDHGLLSYYEGFRANDIDLEILPDLTDHDLREIGVHSLGHRKRLKKLISELPTRAAQDVTALPPATNLERRQVTVIFADVSDFTGLSHRHSSEEIVGILNEFFDRADGAIEAHGGRVDKHIGDCTIGVFGLEGATGHESQNTAAAALDMLEKFKVPLEDAGLTLGVHIGIASGLVVLEKSADGNIREGAFSIAGNAINLAARLSDTAKAGEILTTDEICRQISDFADSTALGKRRIKGFPREVAVRRLLGLKKTSGPSTFVGREPELALLRTGLRDAQQGNGSVVCLRGEAGIGKSTLVARFLDEASDQNVKIATALVLDSGASRQLHPVQSIARQLLSGAVGGQRVPARSIEALAIGQRIDDSTRLFLYLLAGLPPPDDLGPLADAVDARRRHTGARDALRLLLALATRRRPVIIFIEDLHWADRLLRDTVCLLAEEAGTLPLQVLLTSRPIVFSIDIELREERGLSEVRTIALAALDPDAALALAQSVGSGASAGTIRDCLQRSQGNPLFLRQLIAHAGEATGLSIPDSIHSIIQSRLDQCPPNERRTLEAAAVLGQVFRFDALQWLSESRTLHLAPSIDVGFVERRKTDFIFSHALIRDCIYEMTVADRRKALHLKAAEWFRDTEPGLHAEHLVLAGSDLALAACLDAARTLRQQNLLDAALATIEQGLSLNAPGRDTWSLGILKAKILLDTGQTSDALDAFAARTGDAPDDGAACRAMIGQIGAMRISDRIDEAHDLLDKAQSIAETNALATELSQIHFLRGALYFPAGRTDECLAEHRLAATYAETAGATFEECRALGGQGDAQYAKGRMRTAYEVFSECLRLARVHKYRQIVASNLFMLGTVRIYLNETAGALADALGSISIAEKTGERRAEIVSRLTAGWIQISMNELEAADENVTAGLAIARDIGALRFEPFLNESKALIEFFRGNHAAARRLMDDAVEKMRAGSQRFIGPWLLGTKARLCGSADDRKMAMEEAETLLSEGCVGHNHYRYYHAMIALGAQLEDADMLRRFSDTLERHCAVEPVAWADYHVARGRLLADILEETALPAALMARFQALTEATDAAQFRLDAVLHAPYLDVLRLRLS